jgi:hypothetical protein
MRRFLVPLVAVGLLLVGCGGDDDDGGAIDAGEGIEGVEVIRIPPYTHTPNTVDYDRRPPAGGDHNDLTVPCGFYEERFPDEYLVHDLEHGIVWLAYSPELDDADRAVIRALTGDDEEVVATPYADLEDGVAVVATAWSFQLTLDSVDDPRLAAFVEEYQGKSTAPEAGVGC